jgi:hypothetical protein
MFSGVVAILSLSLSPSLLFLYRSLSVVREFILIFLFWVVGGCRGGRTKLYPTKEEKRRRRRKKRKRRKSKRIIFF